MKKVLVTGSTGLVGTYLVAELLRGEYTVVAHGSSETSFAKLDWLLGKKGLSAKPYARVAVRLEDIDDCRRLVREAGPVDMVFHCAAKVAVGSVRKGKGERLVTDNVEMTRNLLIAVQETVADNTQPKKPLFIQVSSVAALGSGVNEHGLVDEQSLMDHLMEASPYARSKFLSENEVWRAQVQGLPAVVVNPAVVLGAAAPRAKFWLGGLMQAVRKGLSVWVDGGTAFVGAADVARAMVLLAETPESWGQRYILSAENLTFRTFLTDVARAVGAHPPKWKIPGWMLRTAKPFVPALSAITGNADPNRFDGSKITRSVPFSYRPWPETWDEITAAQEKI